MLTKEALQEAYEAGAQQALEDAGLLKEASKFRKWLAERATDMVSKRQPKGMRDAAFKRVEPLLREKEGPAAYRKTVDRGSRDFVQESRPRKGEGKGPGVGVNENIVRRLTPKP